MNAQSGADFLEIAADGMTALLSNSLGQLGPGMERPAVGPITWTDLCVMFCFLLGLLLLNTVVVGCCGITRKRRAPARKASTGADNYWTPWENPPTCSSGFLGFI
jgi:hypothetical protein